MDHAHGCSQFCVNTQDITFYVPTESKDFLCNYIYSGLQMNSHRRLQHLNKCFNVIGVSPNDTININRDKNATIVVDIIKCDHSIPTVGFCFSEVRLKLKNEYNGIFSPEIRQLKKSGIEVTEKIKFPQFIYIGDTTINVFTLNPQILTSGFPTIIIECTFLYDDDYENSKQKKHIHWNDLKPIIISHDTIIFILIHFSLRYKDNDIKLFFDQQNIKNIIPWIGPDQFL